MGDHVKGVFRSPKESQPRVEQNPLLESLWVMEPQRAARLFSFFSFSARLSLQPRAREAYLFSNSSKQRQLSLAVTYISGSCTNPSRCEALSFLALYQSVGSSSRFL